MAKFSSKHYVAVANVLRNETAKALAYDREHNTREAWLTVLNVQNSFARMFETDNPGFNRGKFRTASEPN